jgi:serine protease Do
MGRNRIRLSLMGAGLCLLVTSSMFFGSRCSFADAKHPAKGSLEFGAPENPLKGKTGNLGPFKTIFADIAETIIPTVVSVIPTKIDTVIYGNNPFGQLFGDPFSGESPFDFFFGNPQDNRKKRRAPQGMEKREYREQGLGCGVIVSKNGYILTNYHVVFGASEIAVKLHDGRQFRGEVVGSDSLSDVAVLKIKEHVDGLPVAYLGNSDNLRAGDWALAVGNPFSLTSTVTAGIISALNRTVEGPQKYQNFIQTDAAINPGNSGGALVDIDGEVIGINTLIYSSSGGYMGIGFAIPINMARQIMEELIYRGEVVRGWIGVSIQDIDQATREALNLGVREGVLVGEVYRNQPADKAGIKRGDVILSINGQSVTSGNYLRNSVAVLEPGSRVPITIFRDAKELQLQITIGTRNEGAITGMAGGSSRGQPNEATTRVVGQLGLTLSNPTPELRERYALGDSVTGVVVTAVDPKFDEVANLLKEGDVIAEVKVRDRESVPVRDIDQFVKATGSLKEGDAVMFLVVRGDNSFYVAYNAGR